MPPNEQSAAVPAQLSLLAIYNPSLGTTDETLRNQIVFYHSKPANGESQKANRRGAEADGQSRQENAHEQLRQVGLAQGMVSFAKNFSNGASVDSIQTEKSRTVLHELEPGWWILARIELTRLPGVISTSPASQSNPRTEYSSREIAPPALIRQQLVKAYSIFLLHHAPSLDELYARLSRSTFCTILERFWTRFIWNWDIHLNGNPVVDVFNGIKLAGGGELGIGVGEEGWGSGEREVLEGFVSRTPGLTDIVVSRFGGPPPATDPTNRGSKDDQVSPSDVKYSWIGCDACPSAHDGVIFSGVGALSRTSLTQASQWMEWIYRYGKNAYGVGQDPTSVRRRKKRKPSAKTDLPRSNRPEPSKSGSASHTPHREFSPGIPPPLVGGAKHQAPVSVNRDSGTSSDAPEPSGLQNIIDPSVLGTETFMKILTLGYGSAWGNTSKSPPSHPRVGRLREDENAGSDTGNDTPRRSESLSTRGSARRTAITPLDGSPGHFILGLCDDLENEDTDDEEQTGETEQTSQIKGSERSKIVVRTLHVNIKAQHDSAEPEDDPILETPKTLEVIIYLYQPFMFTFLFEPATPSLSSSSFYRSIHHQLGPLQRPLLSSTSPETVLERLSQHGVTEGAATQRQQIYHLIYDPTNGTVLSSLPNIPEPGLPSLQKARIVPSSSSTPEPPQWSRPDALNVHSQLLNTYIETRTSPSEIERTCKTNRGWWVLWMRVKDQPTKQHETSTSTSNPTPSTPRHPRSFKEAFLVRRSSDYYALGHTQRGASSGSGFFRNFSALSGVSATSQAAGDAGNAPSGSGSGAGAGAPAKIAEGVGLDARRYIGALLSLS